MASQITSSHPKTLQLGWSSLSGRLLDGGFELQEMLEADETQARFKVRVLGDRDLDCVALFFELSGVQAGEQVELWTLTRQLRHPHISAPLGAGQVLLDGVSAVYAVVRRADESLDSVLGDRALTAGEAGDALDSVAKGLEILHLNGLVHGCLAPSRVLAVGESIKLPAECVRKVGVTPAIRVFSPAYLAPESPGENLTPESDLWCLGATLFEALTQKAWTEDSREETAALPEPFATIALRCLHTDPTGRANLAEVIALLRGELKPVPRVRAAVAGSSPALIVPEIELAPTSIAKSFAGIEPKAEIVDSFDFAAPVELDVVPQGLGVPRSPIESVAAFDREGSLAPPNIPASSDESAAKPSISPRPTFDEAIRSEPARRRVPLDESEEPATSLWIWAGLTVLVVLGLIWALRPKNTNLAPHPTPSAATSERAPVPVVPTVSGRSSTANAWETRTLQPDGSALPAAPLASGKGKERGVSSTPAGNSDLWRVVAFTYTRKEDADKKVQSINSKHGNLRAEIFSPSGTGSPFLVTLGGRMTHDEAAQAKRKAVGAGMPHDSYIQNYTH